MSAPCDCGGLYMNRDGTVNHGNFCASLPPRPPCPVFSWSGIQHHLPQPRLIFTILADGHPIAAICLRDNTVTSPTLLMHAICDLLEEFTDEHTPPGDTP